MWTPFLNACLQWGADTVTYLWLPVLTWSLCGAAALTLSDRFDRFRLSYAALFGLLLMLPLGIGLNALVQLVGSSPTALATTTALTLPSSTLPSATALVSADAPWRPVVSTLLMVVLAGAALVAGAALLLSIGRAVRLCCSAWMLPQSVTSTIVPAAVLDEVAALAQQFGIRRPIHVELSNTLTSPHTYGWRRPVLILPAALADAPEELRMACLHELAHIQRHDFAFHWLDLLISEVFFFVPVVQQVRARLHVYREQACDLAVLRHGNISPRRYAHFLLQYVTAVPSRPALALTLHAPDSELKQRVRAMKDHTSSKTLTPMQTGLLVALLMASAAALIIAISQSLSPNAPQLTEAAPEPAVETETFVVVEEMPRLVGGLEGLQQSLRYPRIAKQAGIEGRVFVQFVVNRDGSVRDAVVARGIGGGCDEEALRAVRAAEFTPGKQRGRTVPVKMSIPITFKLQEAPSASAEIGEPTYETASLELSNLSIEGRTVSGMIQDAEKGQPLAGANIYIPRTSIGAVTDRDGTFVLRDVPEGTQSFTISYVGYSSITVDLAQ